MIALGLFLLTLLDAVQTAVMALWGRRELDRATVPLTEAQGGPAVSYVRPVKGLDATFEECLFTLTRQEGEAILAFELPDDPAIPEARRLAGDRVQIHVHPRHPDLNGKASNLHHGALWASGEIFVLTDADMRLPPHFTEIVQGALQGADAMAAVPRHSEPQGLFGRLYALVINRTMFRDFLPFHRLATRIGVPGGTVALKKEAYEAIGGALAFGRYITEDFALGRSLKAHGKRVVLVPVVDSPVGRVTWTRLLSLMDRGAVISNRMLPFPLPLLTYIGTLPLPLLGLLTLWPPHPFLLFLLAWLAQGLAISLLSKVHGLPLSPFEVLVLPFLSLLAVIVLVKNLVHPYLSWRGHRYRIGRGGEILPLPPKEGVFFPKK